MSNLKYLGGLGVVLLLLWLGGIHLPRTPLLPVPQAQPPTVIPDALLPCLPRSRRQTLKAVLQSGTTTYYVIGSYQPEYRQVLIARDRHHQCDRITPDPASVPDNFLSAHVSIELAQQLTLQVYAQAIQALGGPEQFQQQFHQSAAQLSDPNPGYLSPEQGWALKQLGIQIPAQIRIVSADQYRQIIQRRSPSQ